MPSQTASIRRSLTLTDRGPAEHSGEVARSGHSSVVRRRPRPLRRSFTVDTIAIAILLAGANYLLFRSDPCWLKSNPTPLLLLPILIGGRYGAGAGLFAGLLTTGSTIGVMQLLGTAPAALFESNMLALAAFPIVGLLCGEIHSFFEAKTLALGERCDQLEEEHAHSSANLELYADSNTDLQRRLAVHGVRFTSLDSELRRLLAPSKNDLFTDALSLLNRVTDVSEAAFYSVGKKNELTREALLGNGDELPEILRADKVEIIDQAIAERQMITCRELWGDTPQLFSRHLAAIPLLDPHGEVGAILLVRRLPFHCVTWQHFAQIETICQWIANIAIPSRAQSQPADRDFGKTAALCLDTHKRHALPSAAVYFITKEDNTITQKKLEKSVGTFLRPTDLTSKLDHQRPNLAVLLPMEGRDTAENFARQVAASLSAELQTQITVTEESDTEATFLARLQINA